MSDDVFWVIQIPVTHKRGGSFLVACEVSVSDWGVLRYVLPEPALREGVKKPDQWTAAEEKPMSTIRRMHAEGALVETSEEWLWRYDEENGGA